MFPSITRRAVMALATLGAAGALAIGLAASAGASVSSTITYTSASGVAGYYAAPNANRLGNGDHMTGVRSTFYLRQSAENNSIDLGVELCRYQNLSAGGGAAAVLYAQWDSVNKVFDIYAGHSSSTNCLDAQGGVPSADQSVIDTIPAGHTVQLEISVSSHHTITYVDSDQTAQTGGRTTFGGFTFGFDRAGVGANGQAGTLTAPASNKVALFSHSAARDGSGWADLNRKGLTRYEVNEVVDTTSGSSAGGVLIAPSPLGTGRSDGNFSLLMGQLSATS